MFEIVPKPVWWKQFSFTRCVSKFRLSEWKKSSKGLKMFLNKQGFRLKIAINSRHAKKTLVFECHHQHIWICLLKLPSKMKLLPTWCNRVSDHSCHRSRSPKSLIFEMAMAALPNRKYSISILFYFIIMSDHWWSSSLWPVSVLSRIAQHKFCFMSLSVIRNTKGQVWDPKIKDQVTTSANNTVY